MYPLRGENRKLEKAKKGIIDMIKSKENQKEEKCKQRGEIEIDNKEGDQINDSIPILVVRRDKINYFLNKEGNN